jgi:hypothetical protein
MYHVSQRDNVAFKPTYDVSNKDELVALLCKHHEKGLGVIRVNELKVWWRC